MTMSRSHKQKYGSNEISFSLAFPDSTWRTREFHYPGALYFPASVSDGRPAPRYSHQLPRVGMPARHRSSLTSEGATLADRAPNHHSRLCACRRSGAGRRGLSLLIAPRRRAAAVVLT